MAKDYYQILGVDRKADADELKKAYRKLAMKWHPDQNKDNATQAEEKFKEINEAYDILKDAQKRAAYDQYGEAAFQQGSGGPRPGGFPGGAAGAASAFSDIFEDMFGDIMGRAGGRSRGPSRGQDMQYTLEINLEDAYKGKEENLSIPVNETCDECQGSGAKSGTGEEICTVCNGQGRTRMQQGFFTIETTCAACQGAGKIIKEPCPKCGGGGRVRKDKTLRIRIPPGVETGRRIRLAGEGEAGTRGGVNGDLYVLLAVKPHKFFQRDGANLYCRVPVQMTTAALGGEFEVPTIDGKRTKVKIPAGTQTGQQFRLKGKGMPILKSEALGDMFIEVAVETPVNLSAKQRDLLKQLDSSMGGKEAGKHSPESSGFMKKVREMWNDLTE
jgi:molecular chaperone DnaJ